MEKEDDGLPIGPTKKPLSSTSISANATPRLRPGPTRRRPKTEDRRLTAAKSRRSAAQLTGLIETVPLNTETPAARNALTLRRQLDETSGTVCADTSGNGLNGVYVGSPGLGGAGAVPGSGNSVDFNGTTQIAQLGTTGLLNGLINNFTVSAWVRPDVTTGNRIIFGCNWQDQNGWSLRLSGGNLALERLGPTQLYSSGGAIPSARWTHVAASYGADNSVTFFTNGVALATIPGAAPATPSTRPWYIGGNGSGENIDGKIDDVQIYRRALHGSEIAFLYTHPGQVFDPIALAPTLSIQYDGSGLILTWPETVTGVKAAEATALTPPAWTPLPYTPVRSGGFWRLPLPAPAGIRFYRLQPE